METDFIYSKYVTGKNFIGRKNDTVILGNLLRQGEDVVIYEPPKTGKTSLVQQTFFNMRISGAQFTLVDFSLSNCRTVADFMMRLGSAVLRVCGSTPRDYGDLVAQYLQGTHFVFDEQLYSTRGQILSLNWDIDPDDVRAVITLPWRIAEGTGQRMYVILDDFQNVMLTEDGDKFCKTMEGIMKESGDERRQHASFIFCGSQVNAMKSIFEEKRYFWRQVEHFHLSTIEDKDICDAAIKLFLSGGKVTERDLIMGVCRLFRCNIWYINHFCSICNSLSKGYIMEPILEEALTDILAIHEPRFKAIMADLTTYQICLLRAILDGHTKFSSAEVIGHYNLNSSANVRRLKDALCKKEIVTFSERDIPEIIDPLFEYWVGKYFFEIK